MLIYPAIDLYEGQVVRLYKGDYARKTVYNNDPVSVAQDFKAKGATHIHLVDLEGAADGGTPNLDMVCRIKKETGLFCEVGGGVRTMEVIRTYRSAGVDRVILGTVAATDRDFLTRAVEQYGDAVAVGVDIRDGQVAIKGWRENSGLDGLTFCEQMQRLGVGTLICTDISKDGAMQGTNRELYQTLSTHLGMRLIASGGVSSLEDVRALRAIGLHGAIIGKAYYTGAIDLTQAIEVAK